MSHIGRTEEAMEELLRDRGASGALCQQGEDGFYSDFAVMFVPTKKRIVYWQPNAKGAAERRIDVSKIFT
jgi:hypothetical protein